MVQGGRTSTAIRVMLGLSTVAVVALGCGGRSAEHRSGEGTAKGGAPSGGVSGDGGRRPTLGGVAGTMSGSGPGSAGAAGVGGGVGASGGEPQGGDGSGGESGESGAGGAPCPSDRTSCGDECVRLEIDTRHCGACFHQCPSTGQVPICAEGACAGPDCGPGFANCYTEVDDCETDLSTPDNCGRCGGRCPPELPLCSDGTCTAS